MKRVLFLRRQMDGFGGMQRISVDIAGLFKKKGYDVYFLAYYKNMNKEESFDAGIEKTVGWYLQNQDWVNEVASGDYLKYYEKMYGER